MANSKQSTYRAKQSKNRYEQNRQRRTLTRSACKKLLNLIEAKGSQEEVKALLNQVKRTLDKTASRGIYPKARVNRIKSRLALAVKKYCLAAA